MSKNLLTLLAVSATALTISACSTTPSSNPADTMAPGQYQKTTQSTDANGTTTTTRKSTDVSVDQYGNKKAVVTSKQTSDPKGLFNKSTTQSESTYQQNR